MRFWSQPWVSRKKTVRVGRPRFHFGQNCVCFGIRCRLLLLQLKLVMFLTIALLTDGLQPLKNSTRGSLLNVAGGGGGGGPGPGVYIYIQMCAGYCHLLGVTWGSECNVVHDYVYCNFLLFLRMNGSVKEWP